RMDIVFKARFPRQRCVLIGLLLFCGMIWGRGEVLSDSYQFENWKTERGLPQNSVLSLLQSQDGYLWIGTRFGLARFDGVHFTTFDPGNMPEMTSENCSALTEDTEGNLWVGTNDGLLRRTKNRFRRFTTRDGLC